MKRIITSILLGSFLFLGFGIGISNSAQAVYVHGYYRSNGTYVNGYNRSAPDGNPYNNYSYPGNTNPYTGKVAPGNPQTYLDNYCAKSPNNAYCGGYVYNASSPIQPGIIVQVPGESAIYYIQSGKRFILQNMRMLNNFGFKASQIKTASHASLDNLPLETAEYGAGNLVKSDDSPAVWRILFDSNTQTTRRSIISSMYDLKKCGYSAGQIKTIYSYELSGFAPTEYATSWPGTCE